MVNGTVFDQVPVYVCTCGLAYDAAATACSGCCGLVTHFGVAPPTRVVLVMCA
jgi:hypothetical protein